MVLFDEDPVTLIRQTTLNFHTASDLASIDRITSSISTLHSARSLRLSSQQSTLNSLSRKLTALSRSHDSEVSSHDSAAHAQKVLSLDTDKFRVAKQASELEIEGERLRSELRSLKGQLEGLEKEGVEGGNRSEESEDEIVLKLRVFRSLGIEVQDQEKEGGYKRAVVRNRKRSGVEVVEIDQESVDRFSHAGHFWGCMAD